MSAARYEQSLWDVMRDNPDGARYACAKLLAVRRKYGYARLVLDCVSDEGVMLARWVECLAVLRDSRAHELLASAVDDAYELGDEETATKALIAIGRTGGRATLLRLENEYVDFTMKEHIRRALKRLPYQPPTPNPNPYEVLP